MFGTTLGPITTNETFQKVYDLTKSIGNDCGGVWIGLQSFMNINNHYFTWISNNEPINSNFWGLKKPDKKDQFCVDFGSNVSDLIGFNNLNCDYKAYFICDVKHISFVETVNCVFVYISLPLIDAYCLVIRRGNYPQVATIHSPYFIHRMEHRLRKYILYWM